MPNFSSLSEKAISTSSAVCILAGGETIVNVTGTGRGGRNQEMALAAAIELHELSQRHDAVQKHRVTLLCGGTDGQDGPTPAAGKSFMDPRLLLQLSQKRSEAERCRDGSGCFNVCTINEPW